MKAAVSPAGILSPRAGPAFPESYRIVRPIGRGSFGEVWQVVHVPTGEHRAAKILVSDDPSLRQSFFHEYAMLFRLRHPGLVRTYEWGELAGGTPFFTMSWAEGPVLEGARLTLPQMLRVLWELVDSLSFVHRQGLIHADLKPDNIRYRAELLDAPLDEGSPRALSLLDFGLTLDRTLREHGDRRGTVPYMAPEWFTQGKVDYRVDLYSLGILIHALVAGAPPFVAEDPLVVVQKHLESEPPLLSERVSGIPAELDEGVARLLAKQPEVRDRGREVLSHYLAGKMGRAPGAGHSAISQHEEALGRYAQTVPLPLLDTWLGEAGKRSVLFVRGGEGLEQERVLEALCPESARYHFTCVIARDPADPRLHADRGDAAGLAALLLADDESADRWADYVRAWLAGTHGPARLAIAVNADRSRQHGLTFELARLGRAGNAHVVSLSGLDDTVLNRLLGQAVPQFDLPTRSRLVHRAAGNPRRLFALAHDELDRAEQSAATAPRFEAVQALEQGTLRESYPEDERLAMAILATSDVAVDRSVLGSIADLPWSQLLSRWMELGYLSTQAGRVRWCRRDLAAVLEAGLPADRKRLLHRAWAEYWGSFAPDPGSDEHQFLVAHALSSNAYRRAVRVGLEAARHWIEKHQAQRGLEILERTTGALAAITDPPPVWVYEQAVLMAEAQRVMGRYADARSQLENVLAHPAVKGRLRWEAEIYKRIGDVCKSLQQAPEGLSALEAALVRYRELGDRVEVSHVLNNIGNIQCVASELDLALASYDEALQLQRQLDRPRDIASTLNNMGGVLVLRSEYDRALAHLTESVGLERTLDDPEALARSLNNLSVAYVETGRYGEADTILNESYRLNLAANKAGEQLFNLENLAGVAMARGEWSAAMSHCEAGLRMCHASDSRQGRMPFLLVTSGVALAQGAYEAVEHTLREVDRVRHRLEDQDLDLAIRLRQAEWDTCRGRYESAMLTSQSVVDVAQQEGLPSWSARGYLQLAIAQNGLEESPDSARRCLLRCLEIAEKIGALPEQIRSRIMLAEAEAAGGSFEQAAEHLRRVERLILECSARPLFLPFSNALGTYYRRRLDLEMALSLYETARKLATYLAMPDWTWRFLASSGHVLVDLKRFDQASGYYRGSVEILTYLADRIPEGDRELYLGLREKLALENGLRICHGALVGIKK